MSRKKERSLQSKCNQVIYRIPQSDLSEVPSKRSKKWNTSWGKRVELAKKGLLHLSVKRVKPFSIKHETWAVLK